MVSWRILELCVTAPESVHRRESGTQSGRLAPHRFGLRASPPSRERCEVLATYVPRRRFDGSSVRWTRPRSRARNAAGGGRRARPRARALSSVRDCFALSGGGEERERQTRERRG